MRAALKPILLNSVPGWVRNAYPAGVLQSITLAAHYDQDLYWLRGRGQCAIGDIQTCTRAQTVPSYAATASGLLVPFAANTNRRTDLGVLPEQAATNLALQSQTLDNAYWDTKSNLSISADATTAPDGTTTADKLVENSAATVTHTLGRSFISASNATTYTLSVYAKAAERTLFRFGPVFGMNNVQFFVDLSNGTTNNKTGGTSSTVAVQALANGWYRISVTDVSTSTEVDPSFSLVSSGTTISYTGDGVSGIYMWGAQLDATGVPTSYIPTTTVAVTRAADSIKANNLSIAAPYSVALSVGPLPATSGDLVNWGSLVNGGGLYAGTGSGLSWVREASATTANVASSGSFAANTAFKLAARFTTNDVNTALNGGIGTHDTSAIPPTIATLGFGTAQVSFSGGMPNGAIKRLTIFSSGLSDAQLQALTT